MVTVLVTLAVAATCLVALEIALRWADHVALSPLNGFIRHRLFPFEGRPLSTYHRTLGWTIAPNLRTEIAGDSLSTDEHSIRLPTPANRPLPMDAILVSGSSFTAGSEVADENSWPAQLERITGTRVVNAAAGGWGTDQSILRAEEMLDQARPRIVIIGCALNALFFAEYRTYAFVHKPYFILEDGRLRHRNRRPPISAGNRWFIEMFRPLIEHSYLVFSIFLRLGLLHRRRPGDEIHMRASPINSGVDISCLLLERFKMVAVARKLRFLIVMEYGYTEFDGLEPPIQIKQVADWARAAGIETVDPWPEMKRLFDEDREHFHSLYAPRPDGKSFGHFSIMGNRFVAENVARVLNKPTEAGT